MITINKNQSNTVVLTLTEKATIDPYTVLFEFVHQMTGEIKLFTAADISTAIGRYNEFDIIETATEDLYDGRVELKVGFHKYTIYEMTPISPADLDPTNAVGILETGKVLVIGTATAPDYFDNSYVKDTPTYQG